MTQSNNVSLKEKASIWWNQLSFSKRDEVCNRHPSERYIDSLYLKEYPTEAEVTKEEETNNPLLADCLSKYIYDKHTQEECSGFIDGFKAAQEKDRALIEELLEGVNILKGFSINNPKINTLITKAEQHLNNQ